MHSCLLRQVFSQATQARGQIHGNIRGTIKQKVATSINIFHLEQQSVLHLNNAVSTVVTAGLTESKANSSVLKASLSFSASS